MEDRILLMHEIPVQSPTSIDVMYDRFDRLADGWDRFAYVLDLTEATRPDAEARAALKRRALLLSPRVAQVAAVVGNNLLIRATVRIVAYGMGLKNVSVHVTRGEALEEARRAVAR